MHETIAPQHWPLIAVLQIKPPIKQREERTGPLRIKWWRFREKKAETISLTRLPTITNGAESWNQMKDTIHSATLGVTKQGKRYINRDTWLWNDDIEMKVYEKKRNASTTNFSTIKHRPIGKFIRIQNGKQRKQSLSPERTIKKNLYDKLGTRDSETDLYRLVKSRNERTQDIEHFCCVNDKNGTLITNR